MIHGAAQVSISGIVVGLILLASLGVIVAYVLAALIRYARRGRTGRR